MSPGESTTGSNRISLREAVNAAQQYLADALAASDQVAERVLLEEVESNGFKYVITLGYDRPAPSSSPFASPLAARTERAYKSLEIDAHTGEVKSMKIRRVD